MSTIACRDSIELILSNGLTLGVLVAIFLHLVLPYHEEDDSLTVVIDGDEKPAKGVDSCTAPSDEESLDGKVRSFRPYYLSIIRSASPMLSRARLRQIVESYCDLALPLTVEHHDMAKW